MKHLAIALTASCALFVGCAPTQTNEATTQSPQTTVPQSGGQLVIAETDSMLSRVASVDIYVNGARVGNTDEGKVLMIPAIAGDNRIKAVGTSASSYADDGVLVLNHTGNKNHFILIEPSLTGPIVVRLVDRSQWEILAKQ